MKPQVDRKAQGRQRLLFVLCGLALAVLLLDLVMNSKWAAASAFGVASSEVPFYKQVTYVPPNGAGAKAGLKVGDMIDWRDLSPSARFRLSKGLRAGETYRFTVVRGRAKRRVRVDALQAPPVDASAWAYVVGAVGALVFATLLAWRRARMPEAVVLSAALVTAVLGVCLRTNSGWATPYAGVDLIADMLGALVQPSSSALIVAYTALFGRPLSSLRRIVTLAAYGILLSSALYECSGDAGIWTGVFNVYTRSGAAYALLLANSFLPTCITMACILLAVVAARARERSLLIWTTAMVFVGGTTDILYHITWYLPPTEMRQVLADAFNQAENVSEFLTPFFIGYALLNRRLMDIGFALNRAVVFSVVSLVTITAFVLVEWSLSEWLNSRNHSTNIIVGAGLALALGLSMRYIHRYVDEAVDRALFSKRRRDQDVLNAFAREAPYITNSAVLLDRACGVLRDHADASTANILLDDREGRYGGISENDPAVVTLRASNDMLDLHAVQTAIVGDYAFPMVSRGRVLGILVLGPKRSGESYAPDEREIIQRVAHGVASTLDVLGHDGIADPTGAKLDAVYDALISLTQAIRETNPALRPDALRGASPAGER